MRTNYVLIDYENVQPEDLSPLKQAMFKVMVFVGANQTKLTRELVFAMQSMGGNAEYVEISGNGPNALDFHISYYIGKLSASEPEAYFHIVSKDVGFDPLITHLKGKKLHVDRVKNIEEIPLLKGTPPDPAVKAAPTPTANVPRPKAIDAKTPKQRFELIKAYLLGTSPNKPKTVKTLTSHINSMFSGELLEAEISRLILAITNAEIISVDDNKVTYKA